MKQNITSYSENVLKRVQKNESEKQNKYVYSAPFIGYVQSAYVRFSAQSCSLRSVGMWQIQCPAMYM